MKKRINIISISFICLILGMVLLYFTYKFFTLNIFENVEYSNISNASIGSNNELCVIDSSNKRVLMSDSNGELAFILNGGSRSDNSFYYATHAISHNDSVFIVSYHWDETGQYIEEEKIDVYDKTGKFISNLYRLEDSSMSKSIPSIRGFSETNDSIYWHVISNDNIEYYEYLTTTNNYTYSLIGNYMFVDASLMIADITAKNSDEFVYITKTGRLGHVLNNQNLSVENLTDQNPDVYPWRIALDSNDTAYYIDFNTFNIMNKDTNTGVLDKELLKTLRGTNKDIANYSLYINNLDILTATSEDDVLILDLISNKITLKSEAIVSTKLIIYRILSLISVSLIMGSILLIIINMVVYLRKKNLTLSIDKILLIVGIIVVVGITSTNIIDYYNNIIFNQAYSTLSITTQNASSIVMGDVLKKIEKPSDFNNYNYKKVYNSLQKIINNNQDKWNENLYSALYTIVDDRYYAMIYNNNEISPYYPFNAWTDDPYYDYFKNAYAGDITQMLEKDSDGEWILSMGPVYDSNDEIVGIVEVGMKKDIFDEWSFSIIKSLIVSLASIIIILVLLTSEFSFLRLWVKEKHLFLTNQSENFNKYNIIRPYAFILYFLIFTATSFIPLMALEFYSPIWNFPKEVSIGLPITAEVLFASITIIISGYIVDKKGWKITLYSGIFVLISAAILTLFTKNLAWFIFARSIAGIGNGLIQITMHGFITTGPSLSIRNESFAQLTSGAVAGTNIGYVFGANIAEKWGYFSVFYIMIALGLLALLFGHHFMKSYDLLPDFSDEPEHIKDITILGFFKDKNVWLFFSCILIPAFICYMFLEYYFPLFGAENGLSTGTIGLMFSLYGLFIVYLGPSISTAMEKYFGIKKSSVMAGVITGASLIIFAMTRSLLGVIVAVIVLALSDSFGEVVYTMYILSIDVSKRMGQTIVAGYLEFFSQFGKLLGTIIFAYAISISVQYGILSIGVATIVCALIFMLFANKVE